MRRTILLCSAAVIVAACNTTPTKQARTPKPAQIEIEESVGFTIVEKSRVNGAVRVDYDRALELLGQGNLADGSDLLESVIDKAPDLSAPQIDLAIAHHRNGDLEAAQRYLDAALDITPNHPIALNELGIIYRKTARFSEARQSYEAALAVYPGYHYARRNLAVLCDLYLADLECALSNYEAYMTTVHSDDEAAMWMKDVRYRLGRTED